MKDENDDDDGVDPSKKGVACQLSQGVKYIGSPRYEKYTFLLKCQRATICHPFPTRQDVAGNAIWQADPSAVDCQPPTLTLSALPDQVEHRG